MREIPKFAAIKEAIEEEMERDESVFLMGEDIGEAGGVFKVTEGLYDKFGEERVIDTPISEAAIVGSGVGSALTGSRPIIDLMYADFWGIPFDQALNQASLFHYMTGGEESVPLTVRSMNGGAESNAAPQHSKSMHGFFMHLPGVRVVLGSTAYDTKGLLKSSIRCDDPVIFFEHLSLLNTKSEVSEEPYTIPLGEAAVERTGADVTVVATQMMLHRALSVAEELDDVSVEVVSPRTVKPLDTETLVESAKKTGRVIVADESNVVNGPASWIARRIEEEAFYHLAEPVEVLGVDDTPIPFSPSLNEEVIPMEDDLEAAICSFSGL